MTFPISILLLYMDIEFKNTHVICLCLYSVCILHSYIEGRKLL